MPAMPPGITTVILTGRYIRPDGTPLRGQVDIEAPAALTLSGADTITSGAATVTLDETGAFSVALIATDNASMQPTGWAYEVTERFQHAPGRSYAIQLPSTTPIVDLADIAPADPAQGDYVLVQGPAGTPGSKVLSGTGTPSAGTGVNGDYYFDVTPGAVKLHGPKASGAWPAGVLISGGSSAVTSVAGRTGAVVLAVADVTGAVATGDSRLSDSRAPSGSASGDLGGTYPSPTVTATHLAAPLPVAQGGTGAASTSAALTALGGVASSEKGAASGVAQLGTDTRILPAQTQTRVAIKSADTSVTSNVTPASDPHLTLSVAANATYDVEVVAAWTNGGGGFRATWTGPSGATMVWTDNDGVGVTSLGGVVTFSGTTGTTFKGTLVVGSTAGTLTLQWAQSTTNAAATILKAGCSLKLNRIA